MTGENEKDVVKDSPDEAAALYYFEHNGREPTSRLANNIIFQDYRLTKQDFYPPPDNRKIVSGIEETFKGEYDMFLKDYYKLLALY